MWCCLPYKGTNFSANHNCPWCLWPWVADVVYPTKVRIFQQITTLLVSCTSVRLMLFTLQRYEFFSKSQRILGSVYSGIRCCLPYKGTNFSANHNHLKALPDAWQDVVYPTKVRIFQQITTYSCVQFLPLPMLFTLQRYEFFSKSQHSVTLLYDQKRCCLPYKGTNFSANHNSLWIDASADTDVVYPTKVRIFQQITTAELVVYYTLQMLFTLQRYEFFSKSQLLFALLLFLFRCCLPYKGTNFSANNNNICKFISSNSWCCLPYKSTNFSANHNVGDSILYCHL